MEYMVPWLIAVVVVGRRMRCPRFQKNLFKDLVHSAPTVLTLFGTAKRELFGHEPLRLEGCPQCGCRFSEPYFGG